MSILMEKYCKRVDVIFPLFVIASVHHATAENNHLNQISELNRTPPSDAEIISDVAVHQRFFHGQNSLVPINPNISLSAPSININNARTRPNHPVLMPNRSFLCMNSPPIGEKENSKDCPQAKLAKRKNRRVGDDAFTASLSALYAKLVVILGTRSGILQ
jgi:hypothetical protein